MKLFTLLLATLVTSASNAETATTCAPTHRLTYQLQSVIQRSSLGYTEGLTFVGQDLYESSGFEYVHDVPDGKSTVNKINVTTGAVTSVANTPRNNFGEGLTYLNHHFYQLTYQDQNLYVYSDQFQLEATYRNPLHEGWGLTNDGKNLIATDGTRQISTIDPATLTTTSELTIQIPQIFDAPLNPKDQTEQTLIRNAISDPKLYSGPNSIDLVNGIYVINLFMTEDVIEVNPADGCVLAYLNLSALHQNLSSAENTDIQNHGDYVLNGTIHDPSDGSFYVFGKRWSKFFKIHF